MLLRHPTSSAACCTAVEPLTPGTGLEPADDPSGYVVTAQQLLRLGRWPSGREAWCVAATLLMWQGLLNIGKLHRGRLCFKHTSAGGISHGHRSRCSLLLMYFYQAAYAPELLDISPLPGCNFATAMVHLMHAAFCSADPATATLAYPDLPPSSYTCSTF